MEEEEEEVVNKGGFMPLRVKVPCAWPTLCAFGEKQCCLLASIINARKREVRTIVQKGHAYR